MADLKLKDFVEDSDIQKLIELDNTIGKIRDTYKNAALELAKGLKINVDGMADLEKLGNLYNTQAKVASSASAELTEALRKQSEITQAVSKRIEEKLNSEKLSATELKKLTKANELGIRVINEEEFVELLKELGKDIMMMNGGDFIIIFGDSAPAELRDYCYSVDVNPINGEIKAGQTLKIDENEYKITCVGEEAPVTLAGLGHCTIRFNGMTEAELPGTLYVEEKAVPEIKVGTTIQIIE